jgi:hypothetical protein
MGNPKSSDESDTAGERRLRSGDLGGAKDKRNPDTELRVDDEEDTLYDDGLDIEEDDETLAGTRGPAPGVK